MIALTLAEVAAAVGGRLDGGALPETTVTGSVEYDSRQVTPGGLFVAFAGERADGHDFAAGAVEAGAVAVIASRPVGVPAVLVDDPLVALGKLARAVVDRIDATVVGVTGSSGKTSTKDLIAQLLSRLGPTVAPPGTFNNELGHPYTVLKADHDTRFLVLEYSARGLGHIDYLCQVAPPRIALVLNVGVAHLGEFGSVDAIAKAKGELVEALDGDGVAILNADDPAVAAMAGRTAARVVRVGFASGADVRATDVVLDERARPRYRLVTPAGEVGVALRLSGEHQVGNTLAAAAVALECGVPLAELAYGLGELRLVSERRMDVFDTTGGVTVIDDSYNANPGSMAAALRALSAVGGPERRRWAVLGYMAELGESERDGHLDVGRLAARLGVDRLVVVGEPAAPIAHGAREESDWGGDAVQVADQEAAIALVRGELRTGDVVLVKGSRYQTWKVADALRADALRADALQADALGEGAAS
ncbi:MAG: UDP-N-acetylmuramoyl-tripeptide--D-alanyl-D-alanine ligase [Micromonosporaceae bacterium]